MFQGCHMINIDYSECGIPNRLWLLVRLSNIFVDGLVSDPNRLKYSMFIFPDRLPPAIFECRWHHAVIWRRTAIYSNEILGVIVVFTLNKIVRSGGLGPT
jgi:hypothetical protein